VSEEELKVYDPVDEIPEGEKPVRTRGSKWDAVIEQALEVKDSDTPWLPVGRPKQFSHAQVKWLRKRNPNILVELGTDRVFIKWDPEHAAALRTREEELEAKKQEGQAEE
jgi:hypothetical protein